MTVAPGNGVVVLFSITTRDLLWLQVRAPLKFPKILVLIVSMAILESLGLIGGLGPYFGPVLTVCLVFILPAMVILVMRNSLGVNAPIHCGFSPSGISAVTGSVRNSFEWSFAPSASENRWYLTVKFKSGDILLPKYQLRQEDVAVIRTMVRAHVKGNVRLW
jgi:hypothetical protein